MSSRILVIESMAVNRIVLKAKMHDAQYEVETCRSCADAMLSVERFRPDLILLSFTNTHEDLNAFCRNLKKNPETAKIAILGLGSQKEDHVRFAAMQAGMDDMLPHISSDFLMFAYIRKLLRLSHSDSELFVRDDTRVVLGFERDSDTCMVMKLDQAKVSLLTSHTGVENGIITKLSAAFPCGVKIISLDSVLNNATFENMPDLLVIDGNNIDCPEREIFRLIADLRVRSSSRFLAVMVVVSDKTPDVSAIALDLGADDVVNGHISAAELAFRTRVILSRKCKQEQVRKTVRNGLLAAVTDELTGLFNRRYAEAHIIQMAQNAQHSSEPFGLLSIDIDFFKTINDTYGHGAGDFVLKELSERLRDELRGSDLVARVGGEEFLVAMPQLNAKQVVKIAERLQQKISKTPFVLPGGGGEIDVTASIGVAMIDGLNGRGTISDVCKNSDDALYLAKTSGRNCVRFYNSSAILPLAG